MTKTKIVKILEKKKEMNSAQLVKELGLSRQMVARHLGELVQAGKIYKKGSTRGARYSTHPFVEKHPKIKEMTLIKKTKGLQEDLVFEHIDRILNLKSNLSSSAYTIGYYAFSEMLNNAIDHSRSQDVHVFLSIRNKDFIFEIKDYGIGLFKNVASQFKLQSELEGLEHVLKGKQTTMPDRHSGQGLFFTSRIADQFRIRSHKIELLFDNQKGDYFVGENNFVKGTLVEFKVKRKTNKSLEELFKKYANEDFEFDRNDVKVKLSLFEGLLSRSQARRIMTGLDKFDQVTLDFKDVKLIGQAFADEIFRVFKNRHPQVKIKYINTVPTVELMILRSQADSNKK